MQFRKGEKFSATGKSESHRRSDGSSHGCRCRWSRSRTISTTVSAIGPSPGDSRDVDEDKVTGSTASTALAKTGMVPHSDEDAFDGGNSAKAGERSLDRTADF